MKQFNKIFLTLLLIGSSIVTIAGSTFEKQMEKEIADLKNISEMESWLKKAAVFEEIARAHSDQWLVYYYESYSYLQAGMEAKEKIACDRYYTQSLLVLGKAEALSSANSEISTLKSWILSMQVSLDPMTRGQELGPQIGQLLSAAIVQDATNPRPYLMQGLAAMYTPEEYGGSKKMAKELINQSIQKFADYKPSSSIMPMWGLEKANEALKEMN